jgi:hypothetical protein
VELRAQVFDVEVGEVLGGDLSGRLIEALRHGDAQRREHVLGVDASGGMAAGPVHEHLDAVAGQEQRGEKVPRQLALLACVRRPVQVHCGRIRGQRERLPRRTHRAGDLFGCLLLDPHQHEEGAELDRFHLISEDHPHRLVRLVLAQATGAMPPLAEDANILCERMLLGHASHLICHR